MFTAYVVVTIVTAASNIAAAVADFVRTEWIVQNMINYGLPTRWLYPLGVVKLAGALGLLAGIAVPALGIAAAAGLVLYFIGAVGTLVRVRAYPQLQYPSAYLLLAVAALVLRLAVP